MPVECWMQLERSTSESVSGVKSFLDYAFRHIKYEDKKILCPCVKCNNRYRLVRGEVERHLLYKGMRLDYTTWYCHGETRKSNSDSDTDGDYYSDDDDDDGCDHMFGLVKEVEKNSEAPAWKVKCTRIISEGYCFDGWR